MFRTQIIMMYLPMQCDLSLCKINFIYFTPFLEQFPIEDLYLYSSSLLLRYVSEDTACPQLTIWVLITERVVRNNTGNLH